MKDQQERHFETIKDAIQNSQKISEGEKSLMYQRLEEWRHENEAMSLLPNLLAEISVEIRPILKEIGLL